MSEFPEQQPSAPAPSETDAAPLSDASLEEVAGGTSASWNGGCIPQLPPTDPPPFLPEAW